MGPNEFTIEIESVLYVDSDGTVIRMKPEEFMSNDDELPFCEPPEPYCKNWVDEIEECDGDCLGCDEDCECNGYEDFAYGIPDVDRIIYNEPTTIVYWDDGTKTIVRCGEGEKFERYAGFMAAVCKKMFGSTADAKKLMDFCDIAVQKEEEKKKAELAKEHKRELDKLAKEEEKKVIGDQFEADVEKLLYQRRVEAEVERRMNKMNK